MKLIAFDTSTEHTSIALDLDGERIGWTQHTPQQHARLLLGGIDRLLAEAGIGRTALDAVAFGCGPGSFTGVRLATAVAQGLSFGLDLPAVPVSTLAALALAALPQATGLPVLALLDARMGEVYAGLYAAEGADGVRALMAEQVIPPAQLALAVEGVLAVCGGGYRVYAGQLPEALLARLRPLAGIEAPDARAIARLARSKLAAGVQEPALPVYLRDRVAQTEAERRAARSPAIG
ncbi:MAG: tRNA (adenosine(37)-N6)-threonylcarbamoyltransferase complex dimerization subunit type 1 TsaB [Xanthomonadales bacterium]|jgi:tRNA threonylcarbamoyladenosine biosynthesis protein TsaB|nr:tRNA (adenosine(37)-N6)-threonylcarbamoyltransferase complex dimerization subunit type 1 TsaB [Xanthomonadales bacterium]